MQKLWVIQSRWDTRIIKKEKEFLKFLQMTNKSSYNYTIKIFTLSEEYKDSKVYFDSFITQKEREEQLKTLLEDDCVVASIQKINNLLTEFLSENATGQRKDYSLQKYLKEIKIVTLNQKSFKSIIASDPSIRRSFLYFGPDSVDWYKTILSIHNFKFENEFKVGRSKVKVDQHRIDNFNEAKKQLKLEKASK